MKDSSSKVILVLVGTIVLLGVAIYSWNLFQEPEQEIELQPYQTERPPLRSFSSERYSFEYPPEYEVAETGEGKTYILTVFKDEKSKLEIFKADEYPGDRAAFGFAGDESSRDVQEYMEGVQERNPKEYLKIGEIDDPHDVWLYYEKGDDETKNELKSIFSSIELKEGSGDSLLRGEREDDEIWEEYNNDEFGFAMKIPSQYSIQKGRSALLLEIISNEQKVGFIAVEYKTKFKSKDLLDFAKNYPTPKDKIKTKTEKTTTIGNLTAVEQEIIFTEEDFIVRNGTRFYFENPDYYVIVGFYDLSDINKESVSSFRFIY